MSEMCYDPECSQARAEHYTQLTSDLQAAQELSETIKREAQIHEQEARTANATIYEIYQSLTEGKGEPGNWNGAALVRETLDDLRAQLKGAVETNERLKSLYDHHIKQSDETLVEVRIAYEQRLTQAEAERAELTAKLREVEEIAEKCGREHTERWLAEIPTVQHSDEAWRNRCAALTERSRKLEEFVAKVNSAMMHTYDSSKVSDVRAALQTLRGEK